MVTQGIIREGYREGQAITNDIIKNNPTFADKVHGVIIAFPVSASTNKKAVEKMSEIYKELLRSGIFTDYIFLIF